MNVQQLSDEIATSMSEVAQRVQRSLVVVHNGRQGAGAGVVWRGTGYIVTNHHVIAHPRGFFGRRRVHSRSDREGSPVAVTLADGRDLPARVIASEPELDLALLQVEADELAPALVADSRGLQVGQMVLAVGHPWGQKNVVTAGIISGVGHAETGEGNSRRQVPIVRSDVTLAPGNSGGPLVNAAGGVVGINTMIVGGDLSVAIPSHIVEAFVQRALEERARGVQRVIRVALVAPALAVRAGLRLLLEAGETVDVLAEAASVAELQPGLPEIDVLVLASARLLGELKNEPLPAVLLLSDEPRSAPPLSELPLRAWGILPLESSAEELQAAVTALHEGLLVISPSLAEPAFSRLLGLGEGQAAESLVEPLTERERQVLQLLAQGLANEQIAASLGISEHTVKFHVSGVYSKLGAASRTEAVRLGLQQGLVVL